MASIKENISNKYIPNVIQEEYANTGYFSIRSGTMVVTDDSEFEQWCDVANLNNFSSCNEMLDSSNSSIDEY